MNYQRQYEDNERSNGLHQILDQSLGKMALEDWKDFVSATATITTIINFLSGIAVVRGFIRKGTTGEASGLPFVAGALNTAVWLKYGFVIDDSTMIICNTVGVTLLSSYSMIFLRYCPKKLTTQKQLVFAFGFYVTLLFYVSSMDEALGHARHILGVVGASLAVCFFGAPLASLSHVIKTGSSEVLPFPLIFSSFLVSGQWWLYGIILDDNFVKIPNFLGWCLATFQLLLFAYYPSSNHRKSSLPMTNSDKVPLLK